MLPLAVDDCGDTASGAVPAAPDAPIPSIGTMGDILLAAMNGDRAKVSAHRGHDGRSIGPSGSASPARPAGRGLDVVAVLG